MRKNDTARRQVRRVTGFGEGSRGGYLLHLRVQAADSRQPVLVRRQHFRRQPQCSGQLVQERVPGVEAQ